MRIVVIGGSGLLGTKVVANLRQQGHEVVAASRSTGDNTLTGEGLAESLSGGQVVVDVANSPSFDEAVAMDFFEFVGAITQSATDGQTVRPLNGMVDLAGPEPIRMDNLARQLLHAGQDSREVVTGPRAGDFGTSVNDQSLTPGDAPRIGPTRFEDWLSRTVPNPV